MRATSLRVQLACLISLGVGAALARGGNDEPLRVPFPEGYRGWLHVKEGKSGAAAVHHIYANEVATKGYATGAFPNGSVIAFEVLSTPDGQLQRIDVMVKDSSRFKGTEGWGYETFAKGDPRTPSLSAEAIAACAACHEGKKDQDRVFSVVRK